MDENSRVIEEGKNEIIQILNQKASTKGKMQRYDAMLEQIGIRKASLSQRILKFPEEAVPDFLCPSDVSFLPLFFFQDPDEWRKFFLN